MSKLHQTAGWSASRSTIVVVEAVERERFVDAERRRRRVGAEADAVPDLALDVLRPAERASSRPSLPMQQPGARLVEAGEVVEVAAVAIRMVVVAVALALGRGRHDRDAAAGRAQRRGDAGAAGGEGRGGCVERSWLDCSGRRGENRCARAASHIPRSREHHAHAIPTSRRSGLQGERALARLVGHVPQPGRRRPRPRRCSPPRWTPASTSSTTPRSTRAARARS